MSCLSDVCACTFQVEREAREAAELAVVNMKAQLESLQEGSSKTVNSHYQEVNNLTLQLDKALAEKQVHSTNLIMLHPKLSHPRQHFSMLHDVSVCSSACLFCSCVTFVAAVMCLSAFRSCQLSHVSVTVHVCV